MSDWHLGYHVVDRDDDDHHDEQESDDDGGYDDAALPNPYTRVSNGWGAVQI